MLCVGSYCKTLQNLHEAIDRNGLQKLQMFHFHTLAYCNQLVKTLFESSGARFSFVFFSVAFCVIIIISSCLDWVGEMENESTEDDTFCQRPHGIKSGDLGKPCLPSIHLQQGLFILLFVHLSVILLGDYKMQC